MLHEITTVPWGDDEGLPVLHLRGSVETPAEADELVEALGRRYERDFLGGTHVELDRYDTAAHAALLIGLHSHEQFAPVLMYGKPGSSWPAAAVSIGLDISEFFERLPEQPRRGRAFSRLRQAAPTRGMGALDALVDRAGAVLRIQAPARPDRRVDAGRQHDRAALRGQLGLVHRRQAASSRLVDIAESKARS